MIQLITLPYYPKAAFDLFAQLATQSWSMLLHSGYSDHPDSRFDILVAVPAVTLMTRGDITEICHDEQCQFSNNDPFLLPLLEYLA